MLFKRKTKEMEVRILTPEEKLDIECQATNCIPTAGKLKRIMEKAENDSESFFLQHSSSTNKWFNLHSS